MTRYGGLVSRSMAYVLDAAVVAVLTSVSASGLHLVAPVIGSWAKDLSDFVASYYLLFLSSIMAIYCALFWLLAGRTPGMAVLGLRVVRTGGEPVRWLACLVRGVLLAYFPIGALWLLTNRRRRGLPDLVAGTTVVRTLSSGADEATRDARIAG